MSVESLMAYPEATPEICEMSKQRERITPAAGTIALGAIIELDLSPTLTEEESQPQTAHEPPPPSADELKDMYPDIDDHLEQVARLMEIERYVYNQDQTEGTRIPILGPSHDDMAFR